MSAAPTAATVEVYEARRDRLGRFIDWTRTEAEAVGGDRAGVLVLAEDWHEQLVELDETLETWEQIARAEAPGLADWIRSERLGLRDDEARLTRIAAGGLADAYHEQQDDHDGDAWTDSAEIDIADLSSSEPKTRARLALKLAHWNGRGPVYSKDSAGRVRFHPRIRVLNLADPLVAGEPWADDVRAVLEERGERISPVPIARVGASRRPAS